MTLQEITQPEGKLLPSSSTSSPSSSNLDPQKSKTARRRRFEIQKLRTSCIEHEQQQQQQEASQDSAMYPYDKFGGHGVVSVMGRRREMEDTVRVEKEFIKKYDYYGVYDGHGGSYVSDTCKDRLHEILKEEIIVDVDLNNNILNNGGYSRYGNFAKVGWDWEGVMRRCFERMDREVGGGRMGKEVEEMTVGSTVVAAVVGDEEVVVANCGDSRVVLCRDGVAIPLSFDHKPDRPDELARIEGDGGRVINWNGYRVLGVLATSRSVGDHYLKPYVSSTPEITITQRTDDDEFLILASDGLWDVITNEMACNVVRRCLTGKIQRKTREYTNGRYKTSSSRTEIAAALLVELAIAKGSKDNISVIVVELKRFARFNCS